MPGRPERPVAGQAANWRTVFAVDSSPTAVRTAPRRHDHSQYCRWYHRRLYISGLVWAVRGPSDWKLCYHRDRISYGLGECNSASCRTRVLAGGVLATGSAIIAQAVGRSPFAVTLVLEAALLLAFVALVGYGAPFSDQQSPGALAAAMFGLGSMGVQSASAHNDMNRAASIAATSIFFMSIIALKPHLASSPPAASARVRTRGVIPTFTDLD
jgi:hypothetical protein